MSNLCMPSQWSFSEKLQPNEAYKIRALFCWGSVSFLLELSWNFLFSFCILSMVPLFWVYFFFFFFERRYLILLRGGLGSTDPLKRGDTDGIFRAQRKVGQILCGKQGREELNPQSVRRRGNLRSWAKPTKLPHLVCFGCKCCGVQSRSSLLLM